MAVSGNHHAALNTYLGIDCGTSAIRICAIDDEQQVQALTHRSLETQSTGAWQTAVSGCLQELFQHVPAESVRSLAVDGTSGTVLLCNETGRPLTEPVMYNDAGYQAELKRVNAPEATPALSATAGLPKVLHLSNLVSNNNAIVQHQSDWISGWLGNRFEYTDENNALKTGYDPIKRRWPDWLRSALPGHIRLPQVVTPGVSIGNAGRELQKLGVSKHATIRAGTTDSTASFLATGVRSLDCGVTTLGSTLVIKQLSRAPVIDLARGIYSHRLGDQWLTGGASNTGGAVLQLYFSSDRIRQLSTQINPQQESGLDYYPLLHPGERFPINDPGQLPRLTPRPENDSAFLHGMLESMARIEKTGYQALNLLGCDRIKRVETAGGGAVNNVWTQIRERISGCTVTTATHTEAAYGSALLAKHGESLFHHFQ